MGTKLATEITRAFKAFIQGTRFEYLNLSVYQTVSNESVIALYNNVIAILKGNKLIISDGGVPSKTTKAYINNVFPFINVQQKKGDWYLNDVLWDGGDVQMTIADNTLHNYNGPAIKYPCGTEKWYVEGKEILAEFYSKEELYKKYPDLLI